jgi:type IV pilus assembly protein PilV
LSVTDNNSRINGAERGFTLIEALVAFVVLAVGIIGIISLLIMSKNSLHQSVQRTRAINLADAMVERIRINPTAIDTYAAYDFDNANQVGDGEVPEPATNCAVATCTPAQLANFDVWAWEQALLGAAVVEDGDFTGGLIEPQACIRFDAQNGLARSGLLNVVIQWRGLEDSTDAVPEDGEVCGGLAAGQDPYRRQVSVNTIVVDEAEF